MHVTQLIEFGAFYPMPISAAGVGKADGRLAPDVQHAALLAAMAAAGRLHGDHASGTWLPMTGVRKGEGLG